MIPFFQGYYNDQHIMYCYQNLFYQNFYCSVSQENSLNNKIAPVMQKQPTADQSDQDLHKNVQNNQAFQFSNEIGKKQAFNHQNQRVNQYSQIQSTNKRPQSLFSRAQEDNLKDVRNAHSNLLRIFFRRLDIQMKQSPEYIKRVIRKNKMRLKLSRLAEWLEINKIEHRNYIRLSHVKKMFLSPRKNQETCKIMRILLWDFVNNDALSYYLTSKKMKRQYMGNNLNSRRKIFNVLLDSSTQD